MISINDIITMTSLERKRRNLGITREGICYHALHSVRIINELADSAFIWCQERFDDDWIWTRNPSIDDYAEILFLKKEDAVLFRLRFETL